MGGCSLQRSLHQAEEISHVYRGGLYVAHRSILDEWICSNSNDLRQEGANKLNAVQKVW